MNVAVIGQIDWYGSMGTWVANGFERNGHNVTRYDRKRMANVDLDHDLYFIVDCSEDFSTQVPRGKIKAPIVFWSFDVNMPMGPERSLNFAKVSDLVFNMNYEQGVETLRKFGVDSYWMPCGIDDHLLEIPCDKSDEIEVAMFGNANSEERKALWVMLNENYKALAKKAEDVNEYIYGMRNAKIIINQPTEPWNNITNIRPFEALGFGKLLLAKKPTIREFEILGLEDKKSFVYWHNFDDLKEKMDYYLYDPKGQQEGLEIATRGEVIGRKHLMSNQVAKMEQIIYSKFYNRLP